jgi:hypothetical protein
VYTFESLYPCRSIRIEDGQLVIGGVFTVWNRAPEPFILLARVSGANAGLDIEYEVKLLRLDNEPDEVWSRAFKTRPPRTGGRPVELTAMFRGGQWLSPGVYVATMILDDGLQSSVTFIVK